MSRAEALRKNKKLVGILKNKRNTMCGLGTRRLKLLLNSLIKKNNNKIAELYRTALEIEDYNIKAKDNYYYSDNNYYYKEVYLEKLIQLCKENNVLYGKQSSDNISASSILYFELPNCEQISFHTNLKWNIMKEVPKYEKEWDGKINSTFDKLEHGLLYHFGNEIKNKIAETKN